MGQVCELLTWGVSALAAAAAAAAIRAAVES